ncbi:hypothetical protein BST36_30835, partial [Mycolicibacterium moriokaense]
MSIQPCTADSNSSFGSFQLVCSAASRIAFSAYACSRSRSDALGQKLISLTAPGVPDVYQGTELWEDSLVDPDNRRPVDY